MKKVLFVVLAICAMIATVAAAPMPASVTLVGVSNGGGGPMFTFRVDGPVNLYNGVIHSVEGEYQGDFPLSCKQEDETTVICHATKKLSGDWVTVEFGGSRFWVAIPDAPETISYCYNYYKPAPHLTKADVGPMAGLVWTEVANICQDTPAANGDIKEYDARDYKFYEDGLKDYQDNNPGPAYYYIIPA